MSYLVLLRHGQSQWNLENRFTGFKDVDLSDQGREEAALSGRNLAKANIKFDVVFTSTLKRAYTTAQIALETAGQGDLIASMIKHDDLRERDYGDLTGLNKDETKQKYGEEQVHIWRRSYDVQPPGGESLQDVVEKRVRPYFMKEIKPLIDQGKNVLVAAHGNSLRALLIILGENTPENINQTEIPTGSPLVIEFENGARKDKYYLSDKVGAEALLDKALASVSPEVKEKVVEFSHTAEEAAKKALHKADELADQAVGKIKAKLDQTDLDEKLTEEAKKLAAKAGEATRQGIIKGADAVKRAAENPDEAKKAVTEAVSGGWNKLKSVLGSGGSGSKE